jgi:Tol biopolymer transport system component
MIAKLNGVPLRIAVAASLAVAGFAFVASPSASAAWLGGEKKLTTTSVGKAAPEVSGGKVAYSDYRNAQEVGDPEDVDTLYDVRVLDVKTGKDRLLTPKHDAFYDPVIAANIVIWGDYKARLWYHNLATGAHKRLGVIGVQAEVDGHRICYDRNQRVYLYDLVTKKEKVISPKGQAADRCHLSGSTVVWESYTTAKGFDVQAYNYATKKRTTLTSADGPQSNPRTDGTWVVWTDETPRTSSANIEAYNLVTHESLRVTPSAGQQWFPDISHGRVVWLNDPDPAHDALSQVHLYDLASGVSTQVTTNDFSGEVRISGDSIVYSSAKSGRTQFYSRSIVAPKLSAKAAKRASAGSTPVVAGSLVWKGRPVADRSVTLEYSINKTTWHSGATGVTTAEGSYTLTGPAITRPTWLRVRFAGDSDFAQAVSPRTRVTLS